MDGGASAFLHILPQRLDVVVMNAAALDAEPFALAGAHEMQRCVGVLKMFVGFDGFQIGATEYKAVRTERIGIGIVGKLPAFRLAGAIDENGICAHEPANWITNVQ